jgi:hypothetical protein
MKIHLISVLFLIINVLSVKGKPVEGNLLIVRKDTVPILYLNIDTFFVNRGISINELHKKYPVGNNSIYIAQWILQNDSLFLYNVDFVIPKAKGDSLKHKIFGGGAQIKMFWGEFTDTIVGKYGRLIRLPNYSGIYEKERCFYIKKGKLMIDTVYCNIEYDNNKIQRVNIVEAFNEIAGYLENEIDWKDFNKKNTEIKGQFIVNKNGVIENITCYDWNKDLCSHVQVLLKNLPDFQILKHRGEPIQETYQFRFDFDYKHRKISGSLILQKWG